jgi:hypothetical protein
MTQPDVDGDKDQHAPCMDCRVWKKIVWLDRLLGGCREECPYIISCVSGKSG